MISVKYMAIRILGYEKKKKKDIGIYSCIIIDRIS